MVVGEIVEESDVVVVGAGPGGYVAAYRCADLGLITTLVESEPKLGGVCLRVGCIPSKALLHIAHLLDEAHHAADYGIDFGKPAIDIDKLRTWKESVVDRLTGGVKLLAGKRKINVVHGTATFESSKQIKIEGETTSRINFKHAIIATGSRVRNLPEKLVPSELCIDSSGALDLENIPKTLLVVGGGYIGLELGQVYAALGSEVSVIEALDGILLGADPDLAKVLEKKLKSQFKDILTSCKLESAKKHKNGVEITYSNKGNQHQAVFEKMLVSIGRQPNSDRLGLEKTKVKVDDRGFIQINSKLQTTDKRIYAIGDVAGDPMLAHKASREGMVAAEVIAGHPSEFDNRAIPAVVYTKPEIAWVGYTEAEAKAEGLNVKVGKFPWGASGRAIAIGSPEGMTKIIAEADTQRVIGVGIAGAHAGDLISEAALAIEMGATTEDLALTIHPHPTTSETVMEAAESVFGTAMHAMK